MFEAVRNRWPRCTVKHRAQSAHDQRIRHRRLQTLQTPADETTRRPMKYHVPRVVSLPRIIQTDSRRNATAPVQHWSRSRRALVIAERVSAGGAG